MKYGEVRRGSIDFRVDSLSVELADQLGVDQTRGAIVTEMYRGTTSYEVGLRPGDVIVEFNGRRVDDAAQLKRMVSDAEIGTTATIKIVREGRTAQLKLPIQSSSSSMRARRRR
jgi:serine protease Do